MNTPLYYTNSTLYESLYNAEVLPSVIRPPIKAAYNTKEECDQAVQIGIKYALENNIQYIDESPSSVIRPPIKGAYNIQEEYDQAAQIGINYAIENNMQYIGYY